MIDHCVRKFVSADRSHMVTF